MAWLTGEAGAGAVLQIGYTAAISRILDADSFGVIAAAGLMIRLIAVLSRNGLQNAIVQAKELSREQIDAAFTFGVGIGAASSVILIAAAPLVQLISDDPRATDVTRVVGLTAFIGAVGSISEGLLRRQFDFRTLAWIGVVAQACGFALGIGSAMAGAGVWSLALTALVQTTVSAALLLAKGGHHLRLTRSFGHARPLIRFGMGSSAIGYFEFVGSSLDTMSVGRWVGTFGLGQYSRATMLVQLPAGQAAGIIGRVLLASMSSLQHERQRLHRVFEATMRIYVLALVSIASLAAVAAPAAVRVLLGEGWEQAIDVLPLVAVGSALTLVAQPPGTLAEAIGELRFKFVATLLQVSVGAAGVALCVATGQGLVGFATSWVASEGARWLAYLFFATTRLDIPLRRTARMYAESVIVATLLTAPLFVTVRVLALPSLVALVVGGVFGVGLAGTVLWPTRGRLAFVETANALRGGP